MAEYVADCPRCGAKDITFVVHNAHKTLEEYGWKWWYEIFSICRKCVRSTTFVVSDRYDANYQYSHNEGLLKLDVALNNYVEYEGYISIKDTASVLPPDFLPDVIDKVFREGATCYAVQCYNAAGTMFRLCIDLATRGMLPDPEKSQPPAKIRRNLGLRLPWLFDNGKLPEGLRDLSDCVKEDGNDGAHAGTLKQPDAEDLMDFTRLLLDRIYTEPERLKLAAIRREERRKPPE